MLASRCYARLFALIAILASNFRAKVIHIERVNVERRKQVACHIVSKLSDFDMNMLASHIDRDVSRLRRIVGIGRIVDTVSMVYVESSLRSGIVGLCLSVVMSSILAW